MKRKLQMILLEVLLLPMFTLAQNVDLQRGLVAYYPFDGNANDMSGNRKNATPQNNYRYENGVNGQAIHLQAVGGWQGDGGGHVILPKIDLGNSGVTLSLWVKEEGLGYWHGEYYIGFCDESNEQGVLRIMHNGADKETQFTYHNYTIKTPFSYKDKWTMYTLSITKSGKMTAYVNGNKVGEQNVSYNGNIITSPAAIGRHWWENGKGTSTRFMGSIDEVRIYNHGLSEEDIKALYKRDGYSIISNAPDVQIKSSGENVSKNIEKDKDIQVQDYSITTIRPSRINNINNEPIGPKNKYKNYLSLPDVGPIAGEFYVGHCNATPRPFDPPITGREMSVIWEYDIDKGMICFSPPQPQGGGDRMVNYNSITFYLANGQQITEKRSKDPVYHLYNADGTMISMPRYVSFYWIYLPDYKYDQIIVSQINAPEQTGKPNGNGYWTNWQDHIHQINYVLPINVREAKAYYYFNQAKKASLKDAITYLKNCTKDNYRLMVENEIVINKTNNISDIIYCNNNYPKLSKRLENKMFGYICSMSDCNAYLRFYSTNNKGLTLDDKVYQYVNTSNEVGDCETYLKHFPNGNHKTAVAAQKNEIDSYNAAKRGGKAECTTYLTKYPNGRFTSEIQSKKDSIVKEENYQAQIKINSNKDIWKLGNKICHCDSYGITMVTLDQWNEDKSAFKGIVIASPGGFYEGTILQKGNQLWIEPKGWYKCLDSDINYALTNDKSAEAAELLRTKNMKFKRGTIVSQTFYSRGLFSSSYTVQAKVEDWNEDYTKMKIQITKTDGLEYLNGESIYSGKYIWVTPIGWK